MLGACEPVAIQFASRRIQRDVGCRHLVLSFIVAFVFSSWLQLLFSILYIIIIMIMVETKDIIFSILNWMTSIVLFVISLLVVASVYFSSIYFFLFGCWFILLEIYILWTYMSVLLMDLNGCWNYICFDLFLNTIGIISQYGDAES